MQSLPFERFDNSTDVRERFGINFSVSAPDQSSSFENGLMGTPTNPSATIVTENPGFATMPITFKHGIQELEGKAHLMITPGHILFSMSGYEEVDEQRFKTVSIPWLNFQFEEHERKRQLNNGLIVVDHKRRNMGINNQQREYDQSLTDYDQFLRKWVWTGVCQHGGDTKKLGSESMSGKNFNNNGRTEMDKLLITVAATHRVTLPNLWPGCSTGTRIALILKKHQWNFDHFVDYSGVKKGEFTPGEYLQFIPAIPKVRDIPPNKTAAVPRREDVAFTQETVIEQIFYEQVDGGLPDTSTVLEKTQKVTFEDIRQGKIYYVGTVWSTRDGTPTDQQVREAMRTHKGWDYLMAVHPIEVILGSSPDFPLTDTVSL